MSLALSLFFFLWGHRKMVLFTLSSMRREILRFLNEAVEVRRCASSCWVRHTEPWKGFETGVNRQKESKTWKSCKGKPRLRIFAHCQILLFEPRTVGQQVS